MVQATADNKRSLEASGYRITEWKGFTDHWIPLYTHKDLVDKKPGDVAFRARVGDPKTLNNGEASYLSRKAAEGFFPWKPDECLSHRFENVTYVKDPLGGTKVIRSEPTMGCKWCRKASAPVVLKPSAECPTCGAEFAGKWAAGSLRLHQQKKHRSTPEGAPLKAEQGEPK